MPTNETEATSQLFAPRCEISNAIQDTGYWNLNVLAQYAPSLGPETVVCI